jgi:hypothetical protein
LKWIAYHFSFLSVFALTIICNAGSQQGTPEENQCFACHTNPGKLIEITRILAKDPDYQPSKSALIKGEG